MKNVFYLIAGFLSFVVPPSLAQNKFSNCSAAFLNNKMIVTEYSKKGKSTVAENTVGKLTVCTAEIGEKSTKAIEKITFRIAIRDKNSKTLVMFSDAKFKQIAIENILKRCKSGDLIVLLTTDNQYALPYNEILVL
ncbi:hypothetical protein [Dyadobacter sp. 3J3]|uniref:hypothetical protein n=1 Tax=Dyadobacter sp. 3J3 TaxID=2606600 RepID=UPI00135803E5|nr:hypothetical protein [Dyadobacter sp. 3J3]